MSAIAGACEDCLRRSWLLARLAAHLEHERARIAVVLELTDGDLIDAVGGEARPEIGAEAERFSADALRGRGTTAGLESICRCDPMYPERLRALEAPPAVLWIAGGRERFLQLVDPESVAVVGSRRATPYGREVARALGRGLSAAGVCVLSGMAFGIDCAAHEGAVEAGGATVAVLPGAVDRPYPASKRALYRSICERGAVVSELPPGAPVWRWMFPARNRIIAALAEATVVVEAASRSGALLTARIAGGLGRIVGAVPGRVTAPLAQGPNRLLASGAALVRDPQDVLDHLFGAGVRLAPADGRPDLEPGLQRLLAAIAAGEDTPAAVRAAGLEAGDGLAALASLELAGYVRRAPGGGFVVLR